MIWLVYRHVVVTGILIKAYIEVGMTTKVDLKPACLKSDLVVYI